MIWYQPRPSFDSKEHEKYPPPSLGFVMDIKDGDLIKVFWYVENYLPHARRQKEWIPASILEHVGTLRVLSKNDLTVDIKNAILIKEG